MGYITYFNFQSLEDPANQQDQFYDALENNILHRKLDGRRDGYPGIDAKWYDWEEDLKKLTKQFPSLVLMVEGDGEDNDDLWVCYFKNGKSKYHSLIVPAPAYDESELE